MNIINSKIKPNQIPEKKQNSQDTGSTVEKNKPLYEKDTPSVRHTMEEQSTALKLLGVRRKASVHLEKIGLNTSSNQFIPGTAQHSPRTSNVRFTPRQKTVGLPEHQMIESPGNTANFVAVTPTQKSRLSMIGARDIVAKNPGAHNTVATPDAVLDSMPKTQVESPINPRENAPVQGDEQVLAQLEELRGNPLSPTGDPEFDTLELENHELIVGLLSPSPRTESPAKPPEDNSGNQTRTGRFHTNRNRTRQIEVPVSSGHRTSQDFNELLALLDADAQSAHISPDEKQSVRKDVPGLMRDALTQAMERKQKDADAAKKFCAALNQREAHSPADVEVACASLGYVGTRQVFNFLMQSPVFTLLRDDPTICQQLIDYAVRLQTQHGDLNDLDIIEADLKYN